MNPPSDRHHSERSGEPRGITAHRVARIGTIFPQTEIGGDAGAVRAYAAAVEELGYEFISIFDHVVGADPEVHAPWNWPYDNRSTFREPLVLFGFLAGIVSVELSGR